MADPMPESLPQTAACQTARSRPQAVIALPAGREPAPLLRSLCALALQRSMDRLWLAPDAFGVVLVPNGPVETVEGVLASLGPALPYAVRITAPVPAGDWALRAGLDAALRWAGSAGVVLSTTAGAVPEAGWVAQALAALAGDQLDAALGEVVPPGRGPDAAGRHAGLLAALAARLDPDPADPSPAHGQESAASLALRGAALRALGGLPVGPAGGVAGLLAGLRRQDGRVRHLAGMRVEATLPPAPVEPARAVWRRLRARRAVREFWTQGTGVFERETPEFRRWAARLGLPAGSLGAALSVPCFGQAWTRVVAESPALAAPAPLPPTALPREIAAAHALLALARLRRSPAVAPPQRPGDFAPGSPRPEGMGTVRKPAGAWKRAGSCGS